MSTPGSTKGQKPEGAYAPGPIESRWLKHGREHDLFRAVADSGREPFTILIPPPNVTGSLHIGHCLNNTTQDVIIRYRRMLGQEDGPREVNETAVFACRSEDGNESETG